MLRPSRRQFAAWSLAAAAAPRRAAAQSTSERLFLFVFCDGGWDPTVALAPLFDASGVDMEPDAAPGEAGGIAFVDHEQRPAVRSFFEQHGHRTCVIHGLEMRSIAHRRCSQLLMSGQAAAADDWGTLLAAGSSQELLLPHLVLSGPSFTRDHTHLVVRAGSDEQLARLLDGTVLTAQSISPPGDVVEAAIDRYLDDRLSVWTASAGRGGEARVASLHARAHDQLVQLRELSGELELRRGLAAMPEPCEGPIWSQIDAALTAFSMGICRSAMVADTGWCAQGWDTHSEAERQGWNFELLFQTLSDLVAALDERTDPAGAPLAERVTVVVCSEMGRFPRLNDGGGKHHWTYTSAMLVGAGVRGGQVIGGYDDGLRGRPVSPQSGEVTDGGTALVGGHLGATILALGDVDPAGHTTASPISAALL